MTDALCPSTRSFTMPAKRRSYKRREPWPFFGAVKKDRSKGCGLRNNIRPTSISAVDRPLKVIVVGRKPVDDWAKQLGFRFCSFVRFSYDPKFISKQVYGVDKVIAVGRTASEFLMQMAIPHYRFLDGGVEGCKQWLGR